jgi:peptide/nickel transport system permease protein
MHLEAVRDFRARHRRALKLARRPTSLVVIAGVGLLLIAAVLGTRIAPYGSSELDLRHVLQGPSAKHLLGSDELGRDVLSRVIAGARYSVVSAASVLTIALVVGTLVGALAGYFGRAVDEVLMRITDVFLAFPSLVLALAISVTLGGGLQSAILAIGAVWWPSYARLVRGQVLGTKSNDYVEAARALGVRNTRLLTVHVLRNCMTPVVVQLTLDVGNVLVTFAGLSYLGLGAPPGSPEWGATISDGQSYILTGWWIALFPGLALYLSALVLNLLGELVGDILMPGRSTRLGTSVGRRRWPGLRRSALAMPSPAGEERDV